MNAPTVSLPMLMSLHDEDFVIAAYELLLGRPADEAGTAYYLGRLRAGCSKLSILQQLRSSSESRDRPHGILGLDKILARYRWSRRPMVGVLLRRWWQLEGEGVQERLGRMMINELACIRQQLQQSNAQATIMARANQARQEADFNRGISPVVEQLSPEAREIFNRLLS